MLACYILARWKHLKKKGKVCMIGFFISVFVILFLFKWALNVSISNDEKKKKERVEQERKQYMRERWQEEYDYDRRSGMTDAQIAANRIARGLFKP